jgi:hypothetical protein
VVVVDRFRLHDYSRNSSRSPVLVVDIQSHSSGTEILLVVHISQPDLTAQSTVQVQVQGFDESVVNKAP